LLEAVDSAANNDAAWQEDYIRATESNASQDIHFEDKVLYCKRRLWIPDDSWLKKQILEVEHNSKVAGHMGQDKAIELVRQNFFWPEMETFIKDYVHSCTEYQKNKTA
jgi:hypothetical protein